jgi:hypothetical protein
MKARLCRHKQCRRVIAAALDAALGISMDGKRRDRVVLAAVALGTPAGVVYERKFLADMSGSFVNPECGEPARPKSLAELKSLHAAAIERDRAERAGQLSIGQVAAA